MELSEIWCQLLSEAAPSFVCFNSCSFSVESPRRSLCALWLWVIEFGSKLVLWSLCRRWSTFGSGKILRLFLEEENMSVGKALWVIRVYALLWWRRFLVPSIPVLKIQVYAIFDRKSPFLLIVGILSPLWQEIFISIRFRVAGEHACTFGLQKRYSCMALSGPLLFKLHSPELVLHLRRNGSSCSFQD